MQQGILSKNMAPQQEPAGQQPQQQPAEQQQQGGGTPDQQVEALTNAMLGALYGSALKSVSSTLKQGQENPEQAIGKVLSGLMVNSQQALMDDNKDVPPGAMFASAMVAAQAIGEMAERMGIIPQGGNGEVIEAGFMLGMAMFGKATKGVLKPEQRQQYAQMIQALTEGRKEAMGQQQGKPSQQPMQKGQMPMQKGQQPRGSMQ